MEASLGNFLSFLLQYEVRVEDPLLSDFFNPPCSPQGGNDYQGKFHDFTFISQSVIHVEMVAKASELFYVPGFADVETIVLKIIKSIVESGQNLPRVSGRWDGEEEGEQDSDIFVLLSIGGACSLC